MADNDTKFVPKRPDFAAKKMGQRVSFKDNVDTIPPSEPGIAESNYPSDLTLGSTGDGDQLKPTHHDDPWDRKFVLTLGMPGRISEPVV
jgi:hypothetical protein